MKTGSSLLLFALFFFVASFCVGSSFSQSFQFDPKFKDVHEDFNIQKWSLSKRSNNMYEEDSSETFPRLVKRDNVEVRMRGEGEERGGEREEEEDTLVGDEKVNFPESEAEGLDSESVNFDSRREDEEEEQEEEVAGHDNYQEEAATDDGATEATQPEASTEATQPEASTEAAQPEADATAADATAAEPSKGDSYVLEEEEAGSEEEATEAPAATKRTRPKTIVTKIKAVGQDILDTLKPPKSVTLDVGGFQLAVRDLEVTASIKGKSFSFKANLKISAGPISLPSVDIIGTLAGKDVSIKVKKDHLQLVPGATLDGVVLEGFKNSNGVGLSFQAAATFTSIRNFMAYVVEQFPIGGRTVGGFIRKFPIKGTAAFALATKSNPTEIISLERTIDLRRGITIFIVITADDTQTGFLRKWFKLESLDATFVIPLPFQVQDPVQISGAITFKGLEFKVFRFDSLELSISKITSLPTFTIAVRFACKMPEFRASGLGWSEWLQFNLQGSVDPAGASIGGGLISPWKNPFGFPGLEIEYTTLEVSLGSGPFGLRGAALATSIIIASDTKIQVAGKIDIANPSGSWVQAYLKSIGLRKIINWLLDLVQKTIQRAGRAVFSVIKFAANLLPATELKEFEFSLAPAGGTMNIGGKNIDVNAGLTLKGDVSLLASNCKFVTRTHTTNLFGIPVPDQEFGITFETKIFSIITDFYLNVLAKIGVPGFVRDKLKILGDISLSLRDFSVVDSFINGKTITFNLKFVIFGQKLSINIPLPITILTGKIIDIIKKVDWRKIIEDLVKAIFLKPLKVLIDIGKKAIEVGKKVITGVVNVGKKVIGGVVNVGKKIGSGVVNVGKKIGGGVVNVAKKIGGGIANAARRVGNAFRRIRY